MTKQIQIAPLRGAFGIQFVIFESVFGHFEKLQKPIFDLCFGQF